jgi:hypothetical protein
MILPVGRIEWRNLRAAALAYPSPREQCRIACQRWSTTSARSFAASTAPRAVSPSRDESGEGRGPFAKSGWPFVHAIPMVGSEYFCRASDRNHRFARPQECQPCLRTGVSYVCGLNSCALGGGTRETSVTAVGQIIWPGMRSGKGMQVSQRRVRKLGCKLSGKAVDRCHRVQRRHNFCTGAFRRGRISV